MNTNYDLNTTEGMANAIAWTTNCMNLLKTGGTWFVPRSSTIVTVTDHDAKTCTIVALMPDPSIRQVLNAAGWTIKEKAVFSNV